MSTCSYALRSQKFESFHALRRVSYRLIVLLTAGIVERC